VSITFVHYLHTKISTVDDISPSINNATLAINYRLVEIGKFTSINSKGLYIIPTTKPHADMQNITGEEKTIAAKTSNCLSTIKIYKSSLSFLNEPDHYLFLRQLREHQLM